MPASPSEIPASLPERLLQARFAEEEAGTIANAVSEEMIVRMKSIRLLACDVDGTLTRGDITYTDTDNLGRVESKTFSIKDGLGIVAAAGAGFPVVWITGRKSALTQRRAGELGVALLLQGAEDKDTALRGVSASLKIPLEAIAYIGDDWNDIPALAIAGLALAPADAAPEVLARVHWISERNGGDGAVREAIATILTAQGRWQDCLQTYLDLLKHKQKASLFDAVKEQNAPRNPSW